MNDDGPPATKKSPFIAPFVRAATDAGHSVSVVIPDKKRSWMSKGHIRGEDIHARRFQAPELCSDRCDWITIDGTPAACVQIGLYHAFKDRGAIDLVVSGPNAGKNVAAVSNLCSGTLGAAMEAALCGRRAIALSFAFTNEEEDMVSAAALLSLRLIRHLYDNWPTAVDVYNVNIPLPKADQDLKMLYTTALNNRWQSPSFYLDAEDDESKDEMVFKWSPSKVDVQRSIAASPPGTDAWAVREGHIRYVAGARCA